MVISRHATFRFSAQIIPVFFPPSYSKKRASRPLILSVWLEIPLDSRAGAHFPAFPTSQRRMLALSHLRFLLVRTMLSCSWIAAAIMPTRDHAPRRPCRVGP